MGLVNAEKRGLTGPQLLCRAALDDDSDAQAIADGEVRAGNRRSQEFGDRELQWLVEIPQYRLERLTGQFRGFERILVGVGKAEQDQPAGQCFAEPTLE